MSTPTELSLSSLLVKIVEASKVLESIPGFDREYEDEEGNILLESEEYIWSRLENLGIYKTEDSHEILVSYDCTEGDARRVFCENGKPNIPVTRFKRVWRILKGSTPETKEESTETPNEMSSLIDAMKPIGQWKDDRLLSEYGPECSSEVEEELRRRSKNRRFVVFSNEGIHEIHQELSLKFLRSARRLENAETFIHSDGKMYRLYEAGQFPSLVYDTCPIHSNQVLMDGYCDQCSVSWADVPENARIFVRVMIEEGEDPTSSFEIRQLIADAKNGFDSLMTTYPKVGIAYNERNTEERLPSLKVRHLGGTMTVYDSKGNVIADPFHVSGGKRRF